MIKLISKQTLERRLAQSARMKEAHRLDPDRNSKIWKGRHHSAATKLAIRNKILGSKTRPCSAEKKAKLRAATLRQYLSKKPPVIDTKPELAVKAELELLKVFYRHPAIIQGIVVDFYIPETRTVIEVDGCYWHGCAIHCPKQIYKQEKDINRTEKMKNAGFKVVRIWEHDIIGNLKLSELINTLLSFSALNPF